MSDNFLGPELCRRLQEVFADSLRIVVIGPADKAEAVLREQPPMITYRTQRFIFFDLLLRQTFGHEDASQILLRESHCSFCEGYDFTPHQVP